MRNYLVAPILRDVISDIRKMLAKSPELARGLTAEEREARSAALRSEKVTGGVAVLPLTGVITPRPSFLSLLFGGGGGLEGFRSQFREALASEDVAAILIDIDSPGGL